MRIRSATFEDADRCAEIYAPYVTDSWVSFEAQPPDAAEMIQRIQQAVESHAWLVTEKDGLVVGYAYASPHRTRDAYKTSCDVAVYLDSEYTGQGIGSALYERLLPMLRKREFHAAFAGIALPNDASIALHRAAGFTTVGTYQEVGWKMGAWRNVEWLQRLL